MPRQTRTAKEKSNPALKTLALVKETELLTSDQDRAIADEKERKELRENVRYLVELINELPRAAKTLLRRLARAEAETLRLVCQKYEKVVDDSTGRYSREDIKMAILELDVALARSSVATQNRP